MFRETKTTLDSKKCRKIRRLEQDHKTGARKEKRGMRNKKASLDSSHTKSRTRKMILKRVLVMILVVVLCNQGLTDVYALGAVTNKTETQELMQEKQSEDSSEQNEELLEQTAIPSTEEPEIKQEQEKAEVLKQTAEPNKEESENEEENVHKQTAFSVAMEETETYCYVGESIPLNISVTKETDISKVTVVAKQNGEESVLYSESKLPKSLNVTPKQSGKMTIIAEVTDTQGVMKSASVTIQCPAHESDTKAVWEKEMAKVTLTDTSWGENLRRIAESQIGYKESKTDFILDKNGEKNYYTRYGAWYGTPYETSWNAVFTSFCLEYANVPNEAVPTNADCGKWITALKSEGLYAKAGEYTPVTGDLVFVKSDKEEQKVGILSEIKQQADGSFVLTVIEGAVKGSVSKVTYKSEEGAILGYGCITFAQEKNTGSDVYAIEQQDVDATATSGDSTYKLGVDYQKYIDSLGDGKENPDTDVTGDNLYRIYLDAIGNSQTKPVDVLFVVDRSGSMTNNRDMKNGTTSETRIAAVNRLLNGSTREMTKDGLISKVLAANPGNKVAVTTFEGPSYNGSYSYNKDSQILLNWTDKATRVEQIEQSLGGTNYMAGYKKAEDMFKAVKQDGNDKLMIFLSDGVPTYYISGSSSREGNGLSEDSKNVSTCSSKTTAAFNAFHAAYPEVKVNTIAIYGNGQQGIFNSDVLSYMANNGGGKLYSATDSAKLEEAFNTILWPTGVTITDELSQYVELYDDDVDLVITKTDKDTGASTKIWSGGLNSNQSVGQAANDGASIIQSVTFTPSTKADSSTGAIKVTFKPEYGLSNQYKFTVSFNVKVTDTATSYLKNNGSYPNKGDVNTDYPGNDTSSNKEGFYSNNNATISYNSNGTTVQKMYQKPVVQVVTTTPDVPHDKPSVDYHKYIDDLNDSGNNTETTVKGDGLYRIYLDAIGNTQTKPVDVLFVVDRSSSMTNNVDMKNGNSKETRIAAVNRLLNGDNDKMTKDGLISKVLAANPENKVAVTTFEGNGSNRDYTYTQDSKILLEWTRTASYVKDVRQALGGTNYSSGYKRAEDMFKKVKQDGNDKLMIFLSDGVPTYYIESSTTRGGNGQVTSSNVDKCTPFTESAFTIFHNTYPEVKVNTIAIYGSGKEDTFSSDVLANMASIGGGKLYSATDSSKLEEAFNAILYPTGVTITDELSQYVELYEDKVDLVITKTDNKSGEVETIWSGGLNADQSIGEAVNGGGAIIQSVKFTPDTKSDTSTGAIKVTFNPEYGLADQYKFTVSFNVKTTDATVKHLLENDNSYPDTGDADTDYPGNTTSSNKEGFYSNASAWITYESVGEENRKEYPKPVVQSCIPKTELVVQKKNADGKLLNGVTFAVFNATVTDGVWTKSGEAIGTKSTAGNGQLTFKDLKPGTYLLYETDALDGYVLPKDPWRVTIDLHANLTMTDSKGNEENPTDKVFTIINYKIYSLPTSGGMGTYLFTITGIAMITVAVEFFYEKRKRRVRKNS